MAEKLKFRLAPGRILVLPDSPDGGKVVAVGAQCHTAIGTNVLWMPRALAESFRVTVDGVVHRVVWDRDVMPVKEEE